LVITGPIIIALMMEAVITSETSVSIYQTTWRNIPVDRNFHTRCRNNKEERYSEE
jgi:hypothetical protein